MVVRNRNVSQVQQNVQQWKIYPHGQLCCTSYYMYNGINMEQLHMHHKGNTYKQGYPHTHTHTQTHGTLCKALNYHYLLLNRLSHHQHYPWREQTKIIMVRFIITATVKHGQHRHNNNKEQWQRSTIHCSEIHTINGYLGMVGDSKVLNNLMAEINRCETSAKLF